MAPPSPLVVAQGEAWDRAVENWRALSSDEGAEYDVVVNINAADIAPTLTWGTRCCDPPPFPPPLPPPPLPQAVPGPGKGHCPCLLLCLCGC